MSPFAEILRLSLFIALPTLVVMALIVWVIKRQHDPMILDKKREREYRVRRRADRRKR